jgi:predicted dehydrogenase
VGNTAHREVAVNALNAGVNVLCEKPTAMNAIEAQAIVDAAEANGRVLQIGMVYRQSAEARLARQYALDGALGQIYHIRTVLIRRRGIPGLGGWFTTKAMSGGGPLIDIGVHWFDLSMFMSDQWNPTAVSAKTYAKFGVDMRNYTYVGMWAGPPDFDGVFDVEDYATGMVRFGSGATMVFDIAWAANTDDAGFIEILGDKGGVRFSPGQPLKVYTEYRGNVADIQPQVQDRGNNFHRQIESFAAACRGEVEPAATGPQGVTAMKIIDGVYASSEQNREVVIG